MITKHTLIFIEDTLIFIEDTDLAELTSTQRYED